MNRLTSRLPAILLGALCALVGPTATTPGLAAQDGPPAPNVLFLLTDQWRAQAFGYAGDPNVRTPHIDRLSRESVNFTHAVSGMPVCCPFRASLMTGQRPLTHGVFMNDVPLDLAAVTVAEVLGAAGYDTGYIGKWHLDGRGRSAFTPPARRQGFTYWKALECTHRYNRSVYYADTDRERTWEGYDAIAQARDARRYIREHAGSERPFALFLSWGTPHAPYHTAPRRYRDLYDPEKITLRPNVSEAMQDRARRDLAGYYAHCTAIDDLVGELRETLEETGIDRDTVLVFTSDHGDLLGSHGAYKKQQPYDESIRVPMLFRFPRRLAGKERQIQTPLNSEDIMPTLLGLCGVDAPPGVEGIDFSGLMSGGEDPSDGAAVISCVQPFGQWTRNRHGGKEYRGIRTTRYTYVSDLGGPWLLFDNQIDPYQLRNLAGMPEHTALQERLNGILRRKLERQKDRFLPGPYYLDRWGYEVDSSGTVPYTD